MRRHYLKINTPSDVYQILRPIKNNRITYQNQPNFEAWFEWFDSYIQEKKFTKDGEIYYKIDYLTLRDKFLYELNLFAIISSNLTADGNPFNFCLGSEIIFLWSENHKFHGVLHSDSYDLDSKIITISERAKKEWIETLNGLYDKFVYKLTSESSVTLSLWSSILGGSGSVRFTLASIIKALQGIEEFREHNFSLIDIWRILEYLKDHHIGMKIAENLFNSLEQTLKDKSNAIKFLSCLGEEGLPKEKLKECILIDENEEKNFAYINNLLTLWDEKFSHMM